MSKFLLSSHPKQQTPAMSPSHPPYRKRRRRESTYVPGRRGRYLPGVRWRMHMHQQIASSAYYFYCHQCGREQQPHPCSSCFLLDIGPSWRLQTSVPENQTYYSAEHAWQTSAEFQQIQECRIDDVRLRSRRWNIHNFSPPIDHLFLAIWRGSEEERPPPKSISSARKLGIKANNDALTFYPSQTARRRSLASKKAGISRIPEKLKGKGTTVSKVAAKRRRVDSGDSSSELSDIDDGPFHFNDNDTGRSFPTFVSASALSSSSDSDAVSSSEFDTDSSMEAEEENFIVAEESRAAEKSRVRRELLGGRRTKEEESP
ncbi:hypothetical protein MSAN_00716600 [Mycena sanguinolenta]|uniref:Uncharacterized protein n=1 Tax=Mycena sanguinolenta TaxID=230812 RepID=A0A8H6Z1C8_9AGAR|nr:hypothetical protein MSAN_00716600 [Mycena sanguinolenta]